MGLIDRNFNFNGTFRFLCAIFMCFMSLSLYTALKEGIIYYLFIKKYLFFSFCRSFHFAIFHACDVTYLSFDRLVYLSNDR